MPAPGDTYLLRKPNQEVGHLWVVLTGLDEATGKVIVVNLTTLRAGSDTTVILKRGDHDFIEHETVVFYLDAQWVPAVALEAAVNQRAGRRLAPFRADVLERICAGLLVSKFTPKQIKIWWQAKFPAKS